MPPRQPTQPPKQQPPIAPVVAAGTLAAASASAGPGPVPAAVAQGVISAVLAALQAAFQQRLSGLAPEIIDLIIMQHPEVGQEEARRIARVEMAREREFHRRVYERVRRDLTEALKIPDVRERTERLEGILGREAHYGELREQAMAARVLARAEMVVLRETSPRGAFWRLSALTAGRHTPDCIAMANKFWPWEVLAIIHPPLHLHCPCTLHPLNEALARGWMTKAGVPKVKDAVRRARKILGDYPEHKLARDELREARFEEQLHPRDRLGRWVRKLGFPAFEVGGAVRDDLIGLRPKDVDYTVLARPEEIQAAVEATGHRAEPLIVRDRLVGVRAYGPEIPEGGVEVAPPRVEMSTGEGRHDFEIVPHPQIGEVEADELLRADAVRRDFTVNAMYRDPETGAVIDPTGRGREDLAAGLLRTTSPDSFREDPLRILRALRFMSEKGFDLHPETREQMREHAEAITVLTRGKKNPGVSGTAMSELNRMLMGRHVGKALREMRDSGVLEKFLPELAPMIGFDQRSAYHDLTLDEHTFSVIERAAEMDAPLEVRLAGLFHDSGKPEVAFVGRDGFLHFYGAPDNGNRAHEDAGAEIAERTMRRLNYPVETIRRVRRLVQHHMVQAAGSKKASRARRWRAEVGTDIIDSLLRLRRADVTAKGEDDDGSAADALDRFAERVAAEEGAPVAIADLAIGGDDLIAAGFEPGPEMGTILQALLRDVLGDPSLNRRDWLLKRAGELSSGQRSWGWGVMETSPTRPSIQRRRSAVAQGLDGFSYNGIGIKVASEINERVKFRFETEAGEDAGYAQVDFLGDRVDVPRVYLLPEYQDGGFGSAFMMELFDQLREQGVPKVTLETVEVGGYAWARAGFVFRPPYSSSALVYEQAEDTTGRMDEVRRIFGQEIGDALAEFMTGAERSEYEVAMWGREHAIDDPYFGKLWPGKAVMLHSQWDGELEL